MYNITINYALYYYNVECSVNCFTINIKDHSHSFEYESLVRIFKTSVIITFSLIIKSVLANQLHTYIILNFKIVSRFFILRKVSSPTKV